MVKLEGRGWLTLRIACWLLVAALVVAPAIAMRYTTEVDWTASDFVFAIVLLGGTGLAIELLMRLRDNTVYRIAAALSALSTLFLIWSNLAVGIIGSENDPFNMLYFAIVPLIAFGAVVTRRQPRGMAVVLGIAAAVPVVFDTRGAYRSRGLLRDNVVAL